ncbi:6-bladed beta-propeller [Gemmatimonadota bacterium]
MPPWKPSRIRHLAFLIAVLGTSSCAFDSPTREWAGTVQDSVGIRLVFNPEQGLWCPGDEWTFSESLTIGADVGDPDYEFGTVANVQVGSDGSIFVFDQMAGEIRVFDQHGTHLRTMGGRGEGPGEFTRGAAGVFLMDGDRLAVPDLGNQRISWMSLEGEFRGSVMASYSGGFPVRWDSDGKGSVIVQRRAMGFNENADLEAGDPLVRIDRDGIEETLVILPKAKTVWMEGATPRFKYFETEPSWDVGPSGTLRTAMTQEYRIELRGPDGSIHTILIKPSPPRPVTDHDKDRFIELMRGALERAGLSPSSINRQINNMSFGATLPAFNQIMEGPDGTTIVQRIDQIGDLETIDLSEEMSRRLGSRTWDAFDGEGRFLGTFDLPARFTPMVWQPTAVYGRWLDDLDRAHVKRLNLVKATPDPDGRCR